MADADILKLQNGSDIRGVAMPAFLAQSCRKLFVSE